MLAADKIFDFIEKLTGLTSKLTEWEKSQIVFFRSTPKYIIAAAWHTALNYRVQSRGKYNAISVDNHPGKVLGKSIAGKSFWEITTGQRQVVIILVLFSLLPQRTLPLRKKCTVPMCERKASFKPIPNKVCSSGR